MDRRKALLLSGSALVCALPTVALAATAPVLHALPDALPDVLPDDFPYEEIVAVNEAFNFMTKHDFRLEERAHAFGMGSYGYYPTPLLRDMVLMHVIDCKHSTLLDRAKSIATIGHELEKRFPEDTAAQRAFLDAPSDQFSFSGRSLREKMTSGYYDLTRAASILAG